MRGLGAMRGAAIAVALPMAVLGCQAGLADGIPAEPAQDGPAEMTPGSAEVEWQGWRIADRPEEGVLRIAAASGAPGPGLSSGDELLARRAVGEYLASTGRQCRVHSFTEPEFGTYEAGYICS